MKSEEKDLILELSCINRYSKDRLKELLPKYATPTVLGYLFFNRMSGVAYSIMKEEGLLGLVGREFRNSLHDAYKQNILKNRDFFRALEYTSEILKAHKGEYAMLKGAQLCSLYPVGCRTSNDIDLLVKEEYLTDIGKALTESGFKQGYIRNNSFIPASRKDIIESKMMRGETVPYILEIDYPQLKYIEIDLNFSLDYKNSKDDAVERMLEHCIEVDLGGYTISTLDMYDFFIQLCLHLYKEASTYPWIQMKRDMTLYKYCDISMLLDRFHFDKEKLFNRACELGADEIISCVILWVNSLFQISDENIVTESRKNLGHNIDIMHAVFSPSEKKQYKYFEKDVRERFFSENREELLVVKEL